MLVRFKDSAMNVCYEADNRLFIDREGNICKRLEILGVVPARLLQNALISDKLAKEVLSQIQIIKDAKRLDG